MQHFLILLATLLGVAASATSSCSLTCEADATCYASKDEAMNCLKSIPFNLDWATATIDTISASLENYGFLQLYHNTGPPYITSLQIMEELAATQVMANNGEFATDMDFQEHIQNVIQITQDAHTRYQKPVCYNAVFLQPFAFDYRVTASPGSEDEEPKAYLMRNLYTDDYLKMFPDSPIASLIDQEVTLLNGLELTTELTTWTDAHETRSNNRGSRFNMGVRSYLFRSAIQYSVAELDDLSITMTDGSKYTFPWMASYTTGLADVDFCSAVDSAATEGELQARKTRFPGINKKHHPELLDPPTPLSTRILNSTRAKTGLSASAKATAGERTIIVPSDSPNMVSCFTQTASGADAEAAGVSNTLVMKVSSFAPPGLTGITGFLNDVETCLATDYDLLVIDVMQNGGGQVCLGLRLLEMLIEDYYNDHSLVQMNYDLVHSPLMDAYIAKTNDPMGYVDKSTGEPYKTGEEWYYGRTVTMGGVEHERTNYFSLDCSAMESLPVGFKPKQFMPPNKLILLTDGTCGSTCACFTKIPSEHGKATLVGAGGLWEESMDVSSFAGGFVANPDSMADVAKDAGLDFPSFATDQHWQFDWAVWYSTKFPSRPAQFVATEPDFRESFWGFPHASIDADVTTLMVSNLYDNVIDSTVARLAAEAE